MDFKGKKAPYRYPSRFIQGLALPAASTLTVLSLSNLNTVRMWSTYPPTIHLIPLTISYTDQGELCYELGAVLAVGVPTLQELSFQDTWHKVNA